MIIIFFFLLLSLWVSWMILLIWASCSWSWLAHLCICSWLGDVWELVDLGGPQLWRPNSASFVPTSSSRLASACSNCSARLQGSTNVQGFWSLGLELASCHPCHVLLAKTSWKASPESKSGEKDTLGGAAKSHCEQMGIIFAISLPHLPSILRNFASSLYLLVNMPVI